MTVYLQLELLKSFFISLKIGQQKRMLYMTMQIKLICIPDAGAV